MKKLFLAFIASSMLLASCSFWPVQRAQKKMTLYNYSKAALILEKAVKKPKYYLQGAPLLATCYEMQHDYEKCMIWYEKASSIPGAEPDLTYRYALSLIHMGRYEKAKEILEKYTQSFPASKEAREKLKQCEVILNDWKDKKPCFEVKKIEKINSPASDFGPAFYANGFTFSSDRGKNYIDDEVYGWTGRQYLKVLFAKPKVAGDFFGDFREPKEMNNRFNQSFHDGPVCYAGDSIAMFTRTIRDKEAKKTGKIRTDLLRIYSTRRIHGDWQTPQPFPYNSYDYSAGHPALSADGKTLYFASDMPGGFGGVDLWMSKYTGSFWSKPVNLGMEVNTTGNEMFPTLKDDGTLFFASDGLPGYGGLDIFSTLPTRDGFTRPENLMAPVNSSFDDFSMAWFPGTTFGMFSSDRPGGQGLDDIYAFKKLPGEPPKIIVKKESIIWGIVRDKNTGLPLKNATVFALNENSDSVRIIQTDSSGTYRLTLDYISALIIKATLKSHIPDCLSWSADSIREGEENKAPRDLYLSKLEVNRTFQLDNIYYDFDKYNIRPDAEPALDALVNIMKENNITIELSSHTDCRGSFAYNDKLSLRRAQSAVDYIITSGIDASRMSSKGYGEYQLVNKCSDGVKCTAAEHQSNRRTEFKVTSFKESNTPPPGTFNPENYMTGDKITREALPADFFMQCR
jgi:outer membrane protein OmpA-like peptidoglycan-associated protein/tetratricopeptide (TPR) repeat protein